MELAGGWVLVEPSPLLLLLCSSLCNMVIFLLLLIFSVYYRIFFYYPKLWSQCLLRKLPLILAENTALLSHPKVNFCTDLIKISKSSSILVNYETRYLPT